MRYIQPTLDSTMYLTLSMDRITLSQRVRPSDVVAMLDRYVPTAILPDAWPIHTTTHRETHND